MNKWLGLLCAALLINMIGRFMIPDIASAQAATFGWAFVNSATLAGCPNTADTTFCKVTGDGMYLSLAAGAAFQKVPVGPQATTGVTSWNGQTGAVTYTPPAAPVATVNGKTGNVVITATTTVN